MTALPSDPFPARFTLGRVLLLAWRGYRQRWAMVSAICLAAGLAGVLVLRLFQPVVMIAEGVWRGLMVELLQFGPSILLALPAIALLLSTHAGYPATFRDILMRAAGRCAVFFAAEILFDAVALLPGLVPMPSLPAFSAILVFGYLIYQVALVALNCICMPTLADEPIGPIAALRRAFSLASGHWLRLLVLGLMIVLSAWFIAVGATFAMQYVTYTMALSWIEYTDLYFTFALPAIQGVVFGIRLIFVVSIATAAYHLLQQAKEGRPAHEMARVFE